MRKLLMVLPVLFGCSLLQRAGSSALERPAVSFKEARLPHIDFQGAELDLRPGFQRDTAGYGRVGRVARGERCRSHLAQTLTDLYLKKVNGIFRRRSGFLGTPKATLQRSAGVRIQR